MALPDGQTGAVGSQVVTNPTIPYLSVVIAWSVTVGCHRVACHRTGEVWRNQCEPLSSTFSR